MRRFAQGGMLIVGLAVAVLIAPAMAEPGNDNRTPDLGESQDLTVPEGHKVCFYTYAEGVQIYRWSGTSWDFQKPDAVLYAGGGIVGIHYGGPTWESASGSYVVGVVEKRAFPSPDAIPWLRLVAGDTGGSGILADVTYIQRVNTTGGLAPVGPGEVVGEIARVPYTADYFFYRKQK
jgi:hypothetical protein